MVPVARLKETEKQFSDRVVETAHLKGWRVMHIPRGMPRQGAWATPIAYDGKGYPDLTMVRERLIVVELKVGSRATTPEQDDWARWLTAAGVEYHLWHPKDWDEIVETLHAVAVPAVTTTRVED